MKQQKQEKETKRGPGRKRKRLTVHEWSDKVEQFARNTKHSPSPFRVASIFQVECYSCGCAVNMNKPGTVHAIPFLSFSFLPFLSFSFLPSFLPFLFLSFLSFIFVSFLFLSFHFVLFFSLLFLSFLFLSLYLFFFRSFFSF